MFDDEIAAQQRMHIRRDFGSGKGPEATGNFGEARWRLNRRGPGQTGGKKRTERKGEPDRGQESKGVGEPGAMEDIRGLNRQSFPSSDC